METALAKIKEAAEKAFKAAERLDILNELRVQYLGKKGELTQILRGMGSLPPAERPRIGNLANEVRQALEALLAKREQELKAAEQSQRLAKERLDISLPGTSFSQGHLHPLTRIINEIKTIFIGLGFSVVEGPELETEYYNFEALNVPADHPARDMQDTFYLTDSLLLRTQTSPVQVRTMEQQKPPVRVIAPGKVYRCDADVTHSPMFHQVEGLLVDDTVTFGDLKGVLAVFIEAMFGAHYAIRFRPSYFPFTEPSAEVDVSCIICGGAGCRICSQTGWLEILGCGMVHPNVLRMAGYDLDSVRGFAFGMGVERIAMLKYRIDDIRLFFESDLRFLRQF